MILLYMAIDHKTRLLKCVDHWIGGPICIALSILNRLTHPVYRIVLRIPPACEPRSILIIKFFGLGSIILSSALVRSLKERYPRAEITYLTFLENAVILRSLGLDIKIRTIDNRNPLALTVSLLRILLHFSMYKPDVSIDLEFYSKFSTMMSYLSGAGWRLGFYLARFWRSSLVNVPVYFNYARHILDIYGMVGAAAGLSMTDVLPAAIRVPLEQKRVAGRRTLGVNVNASDLAYCRRWSRERFAEVITALVTDDPNLSVFLTGSEKEAAYTRSILPLIPEHARGRVQDLSGQLSFGQFLSTLRSLDLFLTNDSGPFHIAKALGVPTVSIWGPGSPDLYGPYRTEAEHHRTVYKRWPCSPCLYIYRTDAGYFCGGKAPCLHAITSADVIKAVRDMLSSRAGNGRAA